MKHELKNIAWFVYPNAYIVCDTTKFEDNDFMEVARITFNDGKVTIRKNSQLPDATLAQIEKEKQRIFAHEPIVIDACGQTIMSGCDI